MLDTIWVIIGLIGISIFTFLVFFGYRLFNNDEQEGPDF